MTKAVEPQSHPFESYMTSARMHLCSKGFVWVFACSVSAWCAFKGVRHGSVSGLLSQSRSPSSTTISDSTYRLAQAHEWHRANDLSLSLSWASLVVGLVNDKLHWPPSLCVHAIMEFSCIHGELVFNQLSTELFWMNCYQYDGSWTEEGLFVMIGARWRNWFDLNRCYKPLMSLQAELLELKVRFYKTGHKN